MPCWNPSQFFSQINNTGIYILGKSGFKKLFSPISEIQSKRFHRKFNTILLRQRSYRTDGFDKTVFPLKYLFNLQNNILITYVAGSGK